MIWALIGVCTAIAVLAAFGHEAMEHLSGLFHVHHDEEAND